MSCRRQQTHWALLLAIVLAAIVSVAALILGLVGTASRAPPTPNNCTAATVTNTTNSTAVAVQPAVATTTVGGASLLGSVDPYSRAALVPVALSPSDADVTADYCVLGGGMAGATAVATLVREGRVARWLLLEARSRLGGRLRSATLNNYTVELGPRTLYGTAAGGNPVLRAAADMPAEDGGPLQTVSGTTTAYFNGNGQAATGAASDPMVAAQKRLADARACVVRELRPRMAAGALPDMSLRDCYALCGFVPRTPEERALEVATVSAEWGESAAVTSCAAAADSARHRAFGAGTTETVDARGLAAVVGAVLKRAGVAPTDARIHVNTRVLRIDTTTNHVTAVRDGTPVRYQCRFLISTLPLGQLQAAQRDQTRLVQPPLPVEAQATLQRLHMVSVRHVWLQYAARFWPQDDAALRWVLSPPADGPSAVPDAVVTQWATVDVPGAPYADSRLVLATTSLASAEAAARADSDDASALVQRLTDDLVRVFGAAAHMGRLAGWRITDADVDDPTNSADWRGAHSNRPVGVSDADYRALWAPVLGHYFATGEAACPRLYGTVEGAYLMGETSARRALINAGAFASATPVDPEANACFV